MNRWAAMLLIPLLALSTLGTVLPLVPPACRRQDLGVIHAVLAAGLLLAIWVTARTWRERRRWQRGVAGRESTDSDAATSRRHFELTLGAWTGTLFCLVIAAQWIAPWVLSPCIR